MVHGAPRPGLAAVDEDHVITRGRGVVRLQVISTGSCSFLAKSTSEAFLTCAFRPLNVGAQIGACGVVLTRIIVTAAFAVAPRIAITLSTQINMT